MIFRFQAIKELENGLVIRNEVLNNYSLEHFNRVGFFRKSEMVPLDFDKLKKDEKYKTLLRSRIEQCEIMISWAGSTNRRLKTLINDINIEIENLKNK